MVLSVLKGANLSAQWYQDTYLGALFTYLEKVCLHTTETKSWPGYSGGASAPNVTYHPLLRSFRQHFENNRSSRALRDPSSTPVRENRDRVWQLEIVAYSDYALARSVGGLWIGDLTASHYTDIAWALIQLNKDLKLPLTSQIRWAEGQKTYVSGRRLSSSGWDACRGIATHFAVSGNTHWDAGGFFYSRLAAKIKQLLTSSVPLPLPPIQKDDDMQVFKLGATRYRMLTGDRYVGVPQNQGELWASQGVKILGITTEYDAFLASTLTAEGLDVDSPS